MRNLRIWWIVVFAVVLGLGGAAQWRAAAAEGGAKKPEPGRTTATVYLRGDAVGQQLNYVPSVRNMPTVVGTLVRMDNDWVVLSKDGKQTLIARPAVLMIETEEK